MKKRYLFLLVVLTLGIIYIFKGSFSGKPVTLTHKSQEKGNEFVERIIILCKHPIPYVILGLDGSDQRLVGVNPETRKTMATKVLGKYFPRFQEISDRVCTKSFTPNIEEIVKLDPDLVLTWEMYPGTIEQMKKFNLNVVGVRYDGSEENDRYMINLLADAIGKRAEADSMLAWRDKVLQDIKTISDSLTEAEKPKAIFLYNYDNFTVGGEKCYEHFCINAVGGINLGAGLGIDRAVNIEQILAWDPDIILYGGWRDDIAPSDIYNNTLLADVSAIKNKRVFKMPHWASNESPLIWMWMAELFHPDKYEYNVGAEIKSVYNWQYGANLTDDEIRSVLFFTDNAVSPHYTNFKFSSK